MPSGIHRFTDLTIAVNPPVISRGTAARSGSTTGGTVFSTSAIRSEEAERLTRRCSALRPVSSHFFTQPNFDLQGLSKPLVGCHTALCRATTCNTAGNT